MFNNLFCQQYIANMEEEEKKEKKDIQKDTLNPVIKVNTKLDKELQEWEVDSTMSGDQRTLSDKTTSKAIAIIAGGVLLNKNNSIH